MKVLYLSLTLYICNLMMRVSPYRTTYDKNGDSFKVMNWAIIPAAVLALIFRKHTGNFLIDVVFDLWNWMLVRLDILDLLGGRVYHAPDHYVTAL